MMTGNTRMGAIAYMTSALVACVVAQFGCSEAEPTMANLGPSELAQEVRSALAEPSYLDRNVRLASALAQLDSENVDAVVEVYDELLKGAREAELEVLFDAWTRFDAPAAFNYSLEIPYENLVYFAPRAASYAWAVKDPLAALAGAQQGALDFPQRASMIYKGMIEGWAMSGEGGLEDYILKGPAADDPGQFILAAQPKIYLRMGVEGLLEWSEEIIQNATEYTARMKTFRYAVRTAGFRDPAAAIPFVMRHYGEEYAKVGPRVLVDTWLHHDSEAAFAWLRTEAPEESREEALKVVVGGWLTRDRQAARSWIDAAPIGDPYYQPAFNSLAQRIAKRDPKEAVEWCNRGQTPEINRTCLKQVATTWYKKDPVAAGVWLEDESGLPVEDMFEVRQRARGMSTKRRTQ